MNKTYIAAAVTLTFFTMNPALAANGYDVRSLSSSSYTDRNESVSNDEYLTKFSEGIQGVDIGICLKGADRMKKESKLYNVSFALSADALKIKNATNTGVQQLFAQSVLGHEGAEEIDISAKKYGIYLSRLSTLDALANDITVKAINDSGFAQSVRILESGSSSWPLNQPNEYSGVNLTAKNQLTLTANAASTGSIALNTALAGGFAHLSANNIVLSAELTGTSGNALAIDAGSENDITVVGKNISLSAKGATKAWGIRNYSSATKAGATITLGNDETNTLSIFSQSNGVASGISSMTDPSQKIVNGGDIRLNAKQIAITSIGVKAEKETNLAAVGIETWENHHVIIGNDQSSVTIVAKANDSTVAGIAAVRGGQLDVNGKDLHIDVSGGSINTGILAQNDAIIKISSENAYLTGDTALTAFSQSQILISGNLETQSETAVRTRGNALVSVNASGNNTVKLTGDVDFNYDAATSGTTTDAIVNINLSNADSSWIGNSKTSVDSGTPSEDLRTGQLNLGLSNGATWTPTEINTSVNNSRAEAIASVTLDNGVINLTTDGASSVNINSLSGNGTVNTEVSKATDGTLTAAGKLNVQSGTSKLSIMAQGITADDVADNSLLAAITGVVNQEGDAAVSTTTTVKEGAVKGEITQTTDASGNTSTTQGSNSKLTAFNSISDMATMAWRHDMNDLTKRMGELRDSPEGIGSWVRFYGSEQEYGRQNVTSKSTSVQLGSDYDIGSGWKVGGAFTYTDGTSKYDNGSSDNKAYGVAAYGSWLADNGAFVDLIGKYSRLSSDFELSSMDGKSKNNALSASVEAGWHIPFAELAFVEPQAELTYGVVLGDDFTTSNGVKISQEDTEALIDRLGVRTGFHFPNKKGTVYARASVLHDFKGESEFTASLVDDASVRSTMKDDIGGTYYEIGVGANFNWTDNAYSYVDLEKQNGGDVKENWRWNVGFRYVW